MEPISVIVYPESTFMKGIVDYYQLVKISEPTTFKTLPNGRLDAWINFKGGFCFFDERSGEFIQAPQNGFFPLSNKSLVIKIAEEIVCVFEARVTFAMFCDPACHSQGPCLRTWLQVDW